MSDHNLDLGRVVRYYDRTESRLGYRLLLGGRKHFGWYEPGMSRWRFQASMDAMEARLSELLNLPQGSELLDAGCGEAIVAENLARRHGFRVVGIDILDFNLERARARLERSPTVTVQVQYGDYHNLDFENSSFDGVYTFETLVHSSDPRTVLGELFRVLRPGGRLVLFEYSHIPEEDMTASELDIFAEICDVAAMPAWRMFADGVLPSLVADAGFIDVVEEDCTERMLPMLSAFASLGRFSYALGRAIGKRAKVINSVSGVEMFRNQRIWSYRIVSATKPTI